ncbi:MAG TPA: single-stranded DNA-binding protein [Candidatus Dormibacteraeota bacterium]|nr:single-stranded DNA-binding protein [Candidatus Dormibacteraeota bacterium]
MVNRVTLVGNLTRDAESLAASTPMTRLRLATNRAWRDNEGALQEEAEYHTIITFGRLAEVCAAYCVKGRRIFVEGRLRTREWVDGVGVTKVTTEIVADSMKLLDRRDEANGHGREGDGAEDDGATQPALASA